MVEKEFKNELETPNEVGVCDDIGIDMIKRNLGAVLDEQDAYAEAVEVAMKSYENYKVQWDVDNRLFQLELENFGKIDADKCTHKIELVPEFWELQLKKKEFAVRQETYSAEKRMAGLLEDVANSQERLESLNEQAVKLTASLKEAGEEVNLKELKEAYK